jgi:excisionase family DNA binding protein
MPRRFKKSRPRLKRRLLKRKNRSLKSRSQLKSRKKKALKVWRAQSQKKSAKKRPQKQLKKRHLRAKFKRNQKTKLKKKLKKNLKVKKLRKKIKKPLPKKVFKKKFLRKIRAKQNPAEVLTTSIQEYPIVLRSEAHLLKIYLPDFELEEASLPSVRFLKKSQKKTYFAKIGAQVLKLWHVAEQERQRRLRDGYKILPPSPAHFPPDFPSEVFYSPEEVAAKMKCHKDTVRRAIDRGELIAQTTPGGHRRIAKSEVVRWLKESGPRLRGRPNIV